MTTIKSFTDLSQSKTLSTILPVETADMYYYTANGDLYKTPNVIESKDDLCVDENSVPCWSLAALLEQFPYELCDDDGNSAYLEINKEEDVYQLVYTDPYGVFESIETDRYEHFVDACYGLILKLNELKML